MVMAGILANAYTYHRSDAEFRQIFQIINGEVPLDEIKGQQIYRGRGAWHDTAPEVRDEVIGVAPIWWTVNGGDRSLLLSWGSRGNAALKGLVCALLASLLPRG